MAGCYDLQLMEPIHPGLASLLVEEKHHVINLAVQGGSNELQLFKIEKLFKISKWKPDVIIFMQCSLMRRYRNYSVMEFRRTIDPDLLHKHKSLNDFDFTKNTVEQVLSPIVHKLAQQLSDYNIPIIIASGNTKMHPVWNEYFDHVMPSADQLWNTAEDSYFSDRDSVDRFINLFLKNSTLDKDLKKELMIQVLDDFSTKWDRWQNNQDWIAWEHGTLHWHEKFYKEIKPFLSTLSK